MRWQHFACVGLGVVVLFTLPMLMTSDVHAATDALADAKRKAAAQLLREGKTADAISLLKEVTAVDDSSYTDHVFLAHA